MKEKRVEECLHDALGEIVPDVCFEEVILLWKTKWSIN